MLVKVLGSITKLGVNDIFSLLDGVVKELVYLIVSQGTLAALNSIEVRITEAQDFTEVIPCPGPLHVVPDADCNVTFVVLVGTVTVALGVLKEGPSTGLVVFIRVSIVHRAGTLTFTLLVISNPKGIQHVTISLNLTVVNRHGYSCGR